MVDSFFHFSPPHQQLGHEKGGFGAQTGQNGNLSTERAVLVLNPGKTVLKPGKPGAQTGKKSGSRKWGTAFVVLRRGYY